MGISAILDTAMWIYTVQYKLFRVSFLRSEKGISLREIGVALQYLTATESVVTGRVRRFLIAGAVASGRHTRYVPAGDSSKRSLHTMFQGFKQGKSSLVNSVVALFQPPAVNYFHCHCPLIVTHGNVHGTLPIFVSSIDHA
jgi:hypothetical protein